MSNRDVISETAKHLTTSGLSDKRLSPLPAGSVLYSMYASVGFAAILNMPAATNQAILGLSHGQEVDPRYLRAFLNAARPHVLREASSNTQDNLNAEKVKNLPFVLPPIGEQIAIASYLDAETARIDGLIEEKKKLKALLAELRSATITDAVMGRIDVVTGMARANAEGGGGVNDYEAYRDTDSQSVLRIPQHWDLKQLKHVVTISYGDALAAEIRIEGDIGVFGSNGQVGTHITANTDAPVVVIGRKGSYGKLNFSQVPVFCIDTAYHVAQSACEADLRFMYYVMQTLGLDTLSQDTGVPGLSRDVAYRQQIALPPPDEQLAIASYLDAETARIDMLMAHVDREIELLNEFRSATITDAVLGRIDVRDYMKN